MIPRQRKTAVPQVNLLTPPGRRPRVRLPRHLAEVGLAAVAIAVWGIVALGVALLLGWHP